MNILKIVCLFTAIWWTLINVAKCMNGDGIPTWNFIFQAIGITGFVVLQWVI